MKRSGEETRATAKGEAKEKSRAADPVLGQEVVERLKSWCYV